VKMLAIFSTLDCHWYRLPIPSYQANFQ
jgi:hypothetical protein